jgi:triosephosphate isomerase
MRTTIIAGNWKMNKTLEESVALVEDLKVRLASKNPSVEVVLCPPFTSLAIVCRVLNDSPIRVGAQNMSQHDDGAYTGEISCRMLKSTGSEYVILGHSERRQYFHETNDLINQKAKKALAGGLKPIICVGETLEEREKGIMEEVVGVQVRGVLSGIPASDMERITLAYEPVWAIGTGKNATPKQAQDVHLYIRKIVGQLFSWQVADSLSIQYGGSVKPDNAAELLAQNDIDGALVGGACLVAESFAAIVASAKR